MWCTIWAVIRKYPKIKLTLNGKELTQLENFDLRNRCLALFHCIPCCYFGIYHFLYFNPPVCGQINTDLQRKFMAFSMSYFIYDTICMSYDGLMDVAMLIHHPLCIIGMYLPLYENFQGNYTMLAVFLTEISNPPMTMRHILRLSGRRYTFAYEICECLFLASYSFCRGVLNWKISYSNLICS